MDVRPQAVSGLGERYWFHFDMANGNDRERLKALRPYMSDQVSFHQMPLTWWCRVNDREYHDYLQEGR